MSPGNDRRGRPRQDGPNVESLTTTTDAVTVPQTDGIPAQLRRRREASLRLPPLDDGLRDPWTAARPPLSVESARAAYLHLETCGLLSELVVDVLARQAALRREVA